MWNGGKIPNPKIPNPKKISNFKSQNTKGGTRERGFWDFVY
jgi:hypothetical protein